MPPRELRVQNPAWTQDENDAEWEHLYRQSVAVAHQANQKRIQDYTILCGHRPITEEPLPLATPTWPAHLPLPPSQRTEEPGTVKTK